MASLLASPLLSIALSGAGTLLSQNSARDAERKQQSILANADIAARKKVQDKNNMIQSFTAENYNPASRVKNYEQAATTANTGLLDAVKAANGGSYGDIPRSAEGKLSDDYIKANATQAAGAANDIMDRARLMSPNGAGSNLFMNEDMKTNQLNSDIGIADSSINNVLRTGQNAAGAVRDKGSLIGGLLAGGAPLASSIFGKK